MQRQVETAGGRAAQRGAAKAVKAVQAAGGIRGVLGKQVATGIGTATISLGATIAAAAAVGVASFMATTYVLNKIKDRKEKAQQTAYEAAQAFRKARLELEARQGRKITGAELKQLYNQFTVGLRERGW